MWLKEFFAGVSERTATTTSSSRSVELEEWRELLRKKWTDSGGEDFEGELNKLFSKFLHIKRKKREIMARLEFIPSEYYELTKNSALHLLAMQDNCDILKHLVLTGKYEIDGKNADEKTPLAIAIHNGNKRMVKLLLRAGATLDNAHYDGRFGPLHQAARLQDIKITKLLIEAGADVNALDEELNSPLHALLARKRSRAVRGWRDFSYWDEHYSLSYPGKYVCELLLESGARVDQANSRGETALHLAIRNCPIHTVAYLLSAGARANVTDGDLRTPLHLAVLERNVALTRRLIEVHRVDTDVVDIYGMSPLCYAIKAHSHGLTRALLDNGASTHILHTAGYDPLFEAVQSMDYALFIRLLVFTPGLRTTHGLECLQIASSYGRLDILKKLLEIGVDVTAKDSEGFGAIFYATTALSVDLELADQFALVKFLLSNGAGVNLKAIEIENALFLLLRFADSGRARYFAESHIRSPDYSHYNVSRMLRYALENANHSGCAAYVVTYVAIFEATGRPVKKHDLDRINSRSDLQNLYLACWDELRRMRERRLHDGVTLLDVLVAPRVCYRRASALAALRRVESLDEYPIYRHVLVENLREIEERPKLARAAESTVMRLLRYGPDRVLPTIVDGVFGYLSNGDLRVLSAVFRRPRRL